jgi:hypothetical protein
VTDQTVPIPLDLLKRLFDNTTLNRDIFTGDSVDVRPGGIGALIDIEAFIPSPPKVGDKLTAAQVATLPYNAVVIDGDGDPWAVKREGWIYLAHDGGDSAEAPNDIYEPYTLVYLPRD